MQPDDVAADVLAEALASADRFDIASAFVTRRGIDHLEQWPRPSRTRLIARAGHGRTDPHAIAYAFDELGIDVRLVAGPAAETFHPKLYLVHAPDRLHVLTGSGNLTGSGLTTSVEQFEWLTVTRGREELAQIKRFDRFWERGLPLAQLRLTPWWNAWLAHLVKKLEVTRT
jgi:HKD family nuclease